MSPALIFALAGIVYSAQVAVSYSGSFKNGPWYYPTGILITILTGLLWFTLAKGRDANQIYVYSLVFDGVIVAAYWLLPLCFFGVKLAPLSVAGAALMIAGMVLVKLGGAS